jgi:hypothetical protein
VGGDICTRREKDGQDLFTQRARQVDFYKYEKGRGKGEEEGAEARAREAMKKREERMRLEATRREAIFARMRFVFSLSSLSRALVITHDQHARARCTSAHAVA